MAAQKKKITFKGQSTEAVIRQYKRTRLISYALYSLAVLMAMMSLTWYSVDSISVFSLVLTLIQFLCQLPANIYNYTSPVWNSSTATDADILYVFGIFMLLSALGSLVSFLLTIPLLLASYLLIDDPSLSAREALVSSTQLMRGNKGRMIYLQFSFLGLWILGILSCGIALLWVQPYITMTMVYFYRELRGELE